jgi:holo-[acyl-carrier protein] synthase
VGLRAGTDIVAVARLEELIAAHGERFLERWFTPREILYCTGKAFPSRHFAARLAAKEAVVKGLRLAADGPVPLGCIEILHDEQGAPVARLTGRVQEAATAAGVRDVQVSLSHCDEYATAVALVEIGDPTG